MSTHQLNCKHCSIEFLYPNKEFNRQTKLGRCYKDFFCSRSCSRIFKNKNRDKEEQIKISNILSIKNKNNEYSKKGIFTYYINKSNNRKWASNMSEEYLKNIWNSQNGLCAISKIPIYLKKGNHILNTASLDRINSKIGYIEGNVQFVAYGINLAKNKFTDFDMRLFLQEIIKASI